MTKESDYVKSRIAAFSSRLVAISSQYKPPGKNAANGIFRDTVVADPEIGSCGRPPDVELAGDDASLFSAYKEFYDGVFAAFKSNENHKDSWDKNIHLAFEAKAIIGDVLGVCKDIIQLVFGSGTAADKLVEQLGNDIQKLVNDVNDSDMVFSGTHANGFISVGVNGTAAKTDQSLGKAWNGDAAQTAAAFRRACQALQQLDTQDHKPWLRAEWQVKFQGIMDGLGRALA